MAERRLDDGRVSNGDNLGTLRLFCWKEVDFEMDHHSQKELRHAANKAFMESLDHLGMSLQPVEPELSHPPIIPPTIPPIDLEDLEAAAEDIAEYMKTLGGEEAARLERERESESS
jgi:hypothetical protein